MEIIHWVLKAMLATGASWVLWLLVGLSIISIGIMMERAYVLYKMKGNVETLAPRLRTHFAAGDINSALLRLETTGGFEARIALEGLKNYEKGPDSVAEAMVAAKILERTTMEQHLAFLGTMGNNAPFIGLFGTVVGIIKAFHDLSLDNTGAARAVMAGISEALVATAMGLFVAIPAVLAFNYFQRRIRGMMAEADGIVHLVLAEVRKRPLPTTPGLAPEPHATPAPSPRPAVEVA